MCGRRTVKRAMTFVLGDPLSFTDVCGRLDRRLAWYGLPLRIGELAHGRDDTIEVVLTDGRDACAVRLMFDRYTGRVRVRTAKGNFEQRIGPPDLPKTRR